MYSKPYLLQGVYEFSGEGLANPGRISDELTYVVPSGKRAQLIYFRGGNSSDALITAVLMRDGKPMRFFPIGAKSQTHVALAVVEDLVSGMMLDVYVAAPDGIYGTVVLDIGLVEV